MIASKRLFGEIITSLLILSGFVAPASGASYQGEDTPHDTRPTRTFEIKVGVLKDVYRVGETAILRVRVTRVIDGHYVGPADGAHVTLGVFLDDVHLASGGTTDPQGRVLLRIDLKSYTPAGFADVTVSASKQLIDLPRHSHLENEYGRTEARDLFQVTR